MYNNNKNNNDDDYDKAVECVTCVCLSLVELVQQSREEDSVAVRQTADDDVTKRANRANQPRPARVQLTSVTFSWRLFKVILGNEGRILIWSLFDSGISY